MVYQARATRAATPWAAGPAPRAPCRAGPSTRAVPARGPHSSFSLGLHRPLLDLEWEPRPGQPSAGPASRTEPPPSLWSPTGLPAAPTPAWPDQPLLPAGERGEPTTGAHRFSVQVDPRRHGSGPPAAAPFCSASQPAAAGRPAPAPRRRPSPPPRPRTRRGGRPSLSSRAASASGQSPARPRASAPQAPRRGRLARAGLGRAGPGRAVPPPPPPPAPARPTSERREPRQPPPRGLPSRRAPLARRRHGRGPGPAAETAVRGRPAAPDPEEAGLRAGAERGAAGALARPRGGGAELGPPGAGAGRRRRRRAFAACPGSERTGDPPWAAAGVGRVRGRAAGPERGWACPSVRGEGRLLRRASASASLWGDAWPGSLSGLAPKGARRAGPAGGLFWPATALARALFFLFK